MGVRNLVGIATRASECGESIGFRHLFNLLDFRKNNNKEGKNLYNLANRVHYKVIDDLPNKDHDWRKFFFFVPISPASVEYAWPGMARWGTLEKDILVTPVDGLEDLHAKLTKERCLWERDFHLDRVIQARRGALRDESDNLSRSDSEDPEVMPQMPSFRDERKKKAQAKAKAQARATASQAAIPVAETSARIVAQDQTPIVERRELVVAGASAALTQTSLEPIEVAHDPIEEDEQPLKKKKRKLSSEEKGKGKASSASKKRKEMPTVPEGVAISFDPLASRSPFPDKVYEDPTAAASLMAKITYPGDRFPIPGLLLNGEFYDEFASQQMKALAHFNRMVIKCDEEARAKQLFIDENVEREKVERRRVAAQIASLKAELDAAKKSSEEVKEKSEEQLAMLKEEMATLRAGREEELASARRAAAAEVTARLDSARELYEKLTRRPMKHMVFFAQTEANIQLLDEIAEASADEPFDFEAERAELEEDKAKFGPGDAAFDEIALKLKEVLGKGYELSINLGDIAPSPRLEIIAKSVGVYAASGSNDGQFGLRLLEAREGKSDKEDEGEANRVDEAAIVEKEVAPVGPQNEEVIPDPAADIVVAKPTGEVASSAVPAQDKEDGEV